MEFIIWGVCILLDLLIGYALGRLHGAHGQASGTLFVNMTDPEKDIFRLDIYEDFFSITGKSRVVLDIKRDASQK